MTPITKQLVEELIEKLAEGLEGCSCECSDCTECRAGTDSFLGSFSTPPVRLGDVLEKLRLKDQLTVDYEDARRRLPLFWESCGFTKSLQEIAGEIEYEWNVRVNKSVPPPMETDRTVEVAKPSPEADLLLFIHNLILNQ